LPGCGSSTEVTATGYFKDLHVKLTFTLDTFNFDRQINGLHFNDINIPVYKFLV